MRKIEINKKVIEEIFEKKKHEKDKSIVTKNLKPYSICVGIPCKEIKKRYNDDVINFLLDLKWWDWNDEKIFKNKDFFNLNLNNYNINYIKNKII